MSRKDYQLIASTLHAAYVAADDAAQRAMVLAIATSLSLRLKADNPRFDALKFFTAVKGG